MLANRTFQRAPRHFGVRYTAITKRQRISVQLLKDFPEYGVRGQIVQVKPSVMINKLHPRNGAVYMNLPDSKPVIPVVEAKDIEVKTKVEPEQKKEPELLTLDDLIAFDLNQLVGSEKDSIIAKLPGKVMFRAEKAGNKLRNPISGSRILTTMNRMVTQDLKEFENAESVNRFFSEANVELQILDQAENVLDSIQQDGIYSGQLLDLRNNNEELHRFKIGVNAN
ncbi:hypothetical protein OGAPHI_002620 [Ogataea philodendri]|uniref:Ribosomal protein L9 domain-containing protein n=1 Tax=Ogataea philodendri TaxID=1378263 RepID=A0A9P8PBY0_9ASCO|nr:uncharacterized protein OGAPHI_002620 [Ogataea philodendri]KAH3668865.1 hypothetical protein OGAPHI_002620 [Ogataea philodendri]